MTCIGHCPCETSQKKATAQATIRGMRFFIISKHSHHWPVLGVLCTRLDALDISRICPKISAECRKPLPTEDRCAMGSHVVVDMTSRESACTTICLANPPRPEEVELLLRHRRRYVSQSAAQQFLAGCIARALQDMVVVVVVVVAADVVKERLETVAGMADVARSRGEDQDDDGEEEEEEEEEEECEEDEDDQDDQEEEYEDDEEEEYEEDEEEEGTRIKKRKEPGSRRRIRRGRIQDQEEEYEEEKECQKVKKKKRERTEFKGK
ncbi:uncharacterized protein PGTG_04228 [Puccinia graminis f. sp. tritici CRL 75-36-700-3]|uniref:Uncharacterized protein n=1 Tax=Puccinia graminis f. sp. tritici (strain CRL 75-36-700-3 / race SCCL) TaxID=418459 RepID=E3K1U7_PUCGT|nr:uncharacterized protein PGTG_04228 [Puccinia graminis f. sp. tritici CRL 75-36-700-3]EFP78272.1 hypothetical protein PGTG_04228 [Puccinia graminis f. sp. tritici CRL 75-36-700-3]